MNLLDYPEDVEAIAIRAAELYGQKWDEIPATSRHRWMDAIKDANVTVSRGGDGETPFEKAACGATREWYMAKASELREAEAKSAPKVTKKK